MKYNLKTCPIDSKDDTVWFANFRAELREMYRKIGLNYYPSPDELIKEILGEEFEENYSKLDLGEEYYEHYEREET